MSRLKNATHAAEYINAWAGQTPTARRGAFSRTIESLTKACKIAESQGNAGETLDYCEAIGAIRQARMTIR